ncbi:MAG: MarR family transcriptional regulator [Ruminococcaceae bacterium]|jgi:DNA-binding MarR family transcriptional regulator|nr:MarR family transcriptional regulator [Oscillospiraceae bacterium]
MHDNPQKLENQLCFPLYAAAKEVVRLYRPLLDPLGLTYTQYIAMLVLWEEQQASMKSLGERLWLDSGTLTPLVKKMEAQGLITRQRDPGDERSVLVGLTEEGKALQDQAAAVPARMAACLPLQPEENRQLYQLLHKTLKGLQCKSSDMG